MRKWLFSLLLVMLAGSAEATPKPLPFTYGADTNPKGHGEVEQYVDMVPVVAVSGSGAPVRYLATQFQTEVEYGLLKNLEVGLYAAIMPSDSSYVAIPQLTEGTGAKQRLRWRLADPGDWPIDVALYGEVTEFTSEIELEWKLILDRSFGKLRLLANAWFEEEFYFDGTTEFVANPTAGVTYQVTPIFSPGIEWWMRYDTGGDWNGGPHQYVGPTMRINFGEFFWTTGLYVRLDDVGRKLTPGEDAFGPIWFRSIVGFGF
ncbi:MAG TPA: hypothetical protein VGH28_32935 [Polyangiaceae bacterium]|jgi:hypothetical protein